ncbi:putative Cholesterol 7-alpha-monooxygenase [Glarea lozoyensis 74030]|uniref:Putative Cholesterol 7-alpha-monooxygenase n=1 Tax=Glarea lozoyensis (strain ATCC 74030 / MF5533) TaxID=1104152 RepID=H0ESU1_GLAL7|nr:putative Cholesterol 7-alpha-monooxygenase [Glarea lozoyensis 74030]
MNDINGFAEWVRSVHPTSEAATIQIAGQHLYLIFDTKLASQIYRRSQTFIFDPFILQTSQILGANKQDMKKLTEGAQVVSPAPAAEDSGSRILHDLHALTPQHLTGKSLDRLTDYFINVICADIDKRFPKKDDENYAWETMDLCEFVKSTWCHASITALFGTNIYEIWPGIEKWLWAFDKEFQKMFTQMPRAVMPKPYALLDEGQEMCEKWEAEALAAEERGEIGGDPDWDKYWGLRFVRLRDEYLRKSGLSTKFRAGNQVVFIWGCYTDQIESLRWATASPSPRVVRQDTQLGPYHLKKGNMAMVHSRTLQMDEATWCIPGKPESHPSKFWAERFLDGDSETEKVRVEENAEAESNYSSDIKASHPVAKPLKPKQHEVVGAKSKEMQARMLALRPFGGGTTLCPGRHFATNEIMGGLAALLLRLEIEVDEDALAKNGSPLPDLSKQAIEILPAATTMVFRSAIKHIPFCCFAI